MRTDHISKIDERLVEAYLRKCGLEPERFPGEDSTRHQKTPDFKVSSLSGKFFFCEVKSILTKTTERGLLHATVHNSFTKNIANAVEQFDSVNSHRLVPNVLVWVSHNFQINDQNLCELLVGNISIQGRVSVNLKKYRFSKRTSKNLKNIDLHIWLYHDGKIRDTSRIYQGKIRKN
ncbi:MAG: hypothetical protein WC156_03660 [Pedobacter sp.]